MTGGFMLMYRGPPRAPSGGALNTEFSTLTQLADIVLFLDGLARIAISPAEAQACGIWTVMFRAKILPRMVAKGTLDWCTIQDIRRNFTRDCVAITPALQSAHIIATPSYVHEVLRTLRVVQTQINAPPMLQVPKPPCGSLASSSQVVRPSDNVEEYNAAKRFPDRCEQAVVHFSNTAKLATTTCASCNRTVSLNHVNAHWAAA